MIYKLKMFLFIRKIQHSNAMQEKWHKAAQLQDTSMYTNLAGKTSLLLNPQKRNMGGGGEISRGRGVLQNRLIYTGKKQGLETEGEDMKNCCGVHHTMECGVRHDLRECPSRSSTNRNRGKRGGVAQTTVQEQNGTLWYTTSALHEWCRTKIFSDHSAV